MEGGESEGEGGGGLSQTRRLDILDGQWVTNFLVSRVLTNEFFWSAAPLRGSYLDGRPCLCSSPKARGNLESRDVDDKRSIWQGCASCGTAWCV